MCQEVQIGQRKLLWIAVSLCLMSQVNNQIKKYKAIYKDMIFQIVLFFNITSQYLHQFRDILIELILPLLQLSYFLITIIINHIKLTIKLKNSFLPSLATSHSMWNIKSSNRLIDLRQKQQAHLRHMRALYNIKPTMQIRQPARYSFLDYKAKAVLKNKQRDQQIAEHNGKLVSRMITMPSYISRIDDVYFKDSLHSGVMRRRQKSIDQENQKIVRKLQTTDSKYSQRAMSKSVKLYQRAKTNMAASKMDQFYDFQSLGHKRSVENFQQNTNSQFSRSRPYSAKK